MNKIFELRIYKMHPVFFPKYVQLTNELLGLRTAHSKLSGFWLTEIGGQNEAVHIWEYDSLAHRKQVRDALGNDDKWKAQYLANIRECWSEQQNFSMTPTFLKSSGGDGALEATPFYRLRIYNQQQQQQQQISSAADAAATTRLAAFKVTSGTRPSATVELHQGKELDPLIETQDTIMSQLESSRIMFTSPWSKKLNCPWH